MNLTPKQQKQIKEAWGDWETVHSLRDEFLMERMAELDPQFMKSLERATKEATLWFA